MDDAKQRASNAAAFAVAAVRAAKGQPASGARGSMMFNPAAATMALDARGGPSDTIDPPERLQLIAATPTLNILLVDTRSCRKITKVSFVCRNPSI